MACLKDSANERAWKLLSTPRSGGSDASPLGHRSVASLDSLSPAGVAGMWSRVLSGTKTGQVLRAGGKEPIQRPFLAGPADRCRVHTYLVCRTEPQMVCRQLRADWTSDFGTDRI